MLEAHYADAIPLEQLKREQARIASARAATEQILKRSQAGEESVRTKLDGACHLLSRAQAYYLDATPTVRRDLNQAVFEKIYVVDNEVVGSDLTPAFRRLLSDSLNLDLATERKRKAR